MTDDTKILLPWVFLFGFSFSLMWLLEDGDLERRLIIFMVLGLVWAGIGFPTAILLGRQYGVGGRFWEGSQVQSKAIVVPLTVAVCGVVLALVSLAALTF